MTILTNARLVLGDEIIDGTVVLHDQTIVEFQPGRSQAPGAIDCEGDVLMPGIVDVHTDNLERQVQPRSNARWPSRSAMLTHDAQCAVSGVTTVLDALCLGDLGFDKDRIQTFHDGVRDLDALHGTGLLKSEHFLHLRCEMPATDVMDLLDPVADHPLVRMVSLMDHSPGVGQYADMERYRAMRRREGLTDARIEQRIEELQTQRARYRDLNRERLLARMAGSGVTLASHDDRTEQEIEENHRDGIRISEFPVSMLAAKAARGAGHAGDRGRAEHRARRLALRQRFGCADGAGGRGRWARERLRAGEPARGRVRLRRRDRDHAAAGRRDGDGESGRDGRVARSRADRAGQRADLLRVREHEGMPVVRMVWRAGSASSDS